MRKAGINGRVGVSKITIAISILQSGVSIKISSDLPLGKL